MYELPIPPEFHALVLRTDFTDDGAWLEVCRLIESFDCEGYTPTLLRVDDPRYDGATVEALSGPDYVFVVDSRAIADPQHPVAPPGPIDLDELTPKSGGLVIKIKRSHDGAADRHVRGDSRRAGWNSPTTR